MTAKRRWIDKAIRHKGALRQELGTPKGKTIPKATLEAAAKKKGKIGRRARLALTLSKMPKRGKKKSPLRRVMN